MGKGPEKDLLYDYVRGKLSELQRAHIEKCLSQSEELRKELEQVKSYYTSIDALEPVEVPDTFLESVKNKIDSTVSVSIFQKIFFPLYIKVPAELAGVAATIMLVVYFFIPRFTDKEGFDISVSDQVSLNESRNRTDDPVIITGDFQTSPSVENKAELSKEQVIRNDMKKPEQQPTKQQRIKAPSSKRLKSRTSEPQKQKRTESVTALKQKKGKSLLPSRIEETSPLSVPSGESSMAVSAADVKEKEPGLSSLGSNPKITGTAFQSKDTGKIDKLRKSSGAQSQKQVRSKKRSTALIIELALKKSDEPKKTPPLKRKSNSSLADMRYDGQSVVKRSAEKKTETKYNDGDEKNIQHAPLHQLFEKHALTWTVTDSKTTGVIYLVSVSSSEAEMFFNGLRTLGELKPSEKIPEQFDGLNENDTLSVLITVPNPH